MKASFLSSDKQPRSPGNGDDYRSVFLIKKSISALTRFALPVLFK
jgi:hypothetical protein